MPFYILAACGFVAGAISIFLPETAGVDLPDTTEEAENFPFDKGFFYMPVLHKVKTKKRSEQENPTNTNSQINKSESIMTVSTIA